MRRGCKTRSLRHLLSPVPLSFHPFQFLTTYRETGCASSPFQLSVELWRTRRLALVVAMDHGVYTALSKMPLHTGGLIAAHVRVGSV